MKFLSLPDFDIVASALNFDIPDCHVTGGCDLYTTKAAGSDKKLYKSIDKSLESQHASLMKLGASLSPPRRDSLAASLNLSRSSPFGPLSEVSSRRTFAYLIATLNASHPDYDFSHVLRPTDFKRERNLRAVMSNLDSTLHSMRPSCGSSSFDAAAARDQPPPSLSTAPRWGPQMWALVDKEMSLKDCTVFSYQPADDPFEEDEGAIWSLHYFFFNKALKRVCYVYVRGIPVISRPRPAPRAVGGAGVGSSVYFQKAPGTAAAADLSTSAKRRALGIGGAFGGAGANKRAKFWLGDRPGERVAVSDDELDEDDDDPDWDRSFDDGFKFSYDDDDDVDVGFADEFDDYGDDDQDEDDELPCARSTSPIRGVSEDIAARMELEV